MPEVVLYDAKGAKTGAVSVQEAVFAVKVSQTVLMQVVVGQQASRRRGTAKAKTRAETRGGGAKPWRQKGTGNARAGSRRSPLWRGGGVTFGPRPRCYAPRTTRREKRSALRGALSLVLKEGRMAAVEIPDLEKPATKTASAFCRAVAGAMAVREGRMLVILDGHDVAQERSFRNLPGVIVRFPRNLSALDVLWAESVLVDKRTFPKIEEAASA